MNEDMRSSFICTVLLAVALAVSGCSTTNGVARASGNSQPVAQPSLGTIVGTVQVALGSGDVKALAFKSVRLVQESYSVLTDSEKADITYGIDEGGEALKLGAISIDEFKRKSQSQTDALQSFLKRLPEKEAIPSIATATTDAGGNFKLDGIKPGTYWVFLDTVVSGNQVGWAVKVDVAAGVTAKVDLNNTNLDYGFR